MAKSTTGRSVATIERATDVLFLFADAPGTLGVTEIANELELSKAVVHRIVTSLCERGLVTNDPATRRYALGPGVLSLASAYLDKLDVRTEALEVMRQLSAETNETATGRELLVRIADEMNHPDPGIVIDGGLEIMKGLKEKDIITGTNKQQAPS